MMDDTLKIKALMIFYEHWGKEERRISKSIDGVKRFQDCIYIKYSNRYENELETLEKMDKTSMVFWRSLVYCLLPDNMDNWVEYYDYITQPLYTKIKFAEMIGVVFYDVVHSDLNDEQMKNVDAIVALPPLRY